MAKTVTLENVDSAYVKVYCDPDVSEEISDQFKFIDPKARHTPRFKKGFWDGTIKLYHKGTRKIYRGLAHQLKEFCLDHEYEFRYEFDRDELFTHEFVSKLIEEIDPSIRDGGSVQDYQIKGVEIALRDKRVILLSSTGSGKSLIIYLICRILIETGRKGVVVVPGVGLVNQLFADFKDYSQNNKWDVDANVHVVFSGQEKTTDKPLVITTWQSLAKAKESLGEYHFIVGDEAHGFKANELKEIMEGLTNTDYRIGTTGTLDGTKVNGMTLEGLFGPPTRIAKTTELQERGILSPLDINCLVLSHPIEICRARSKEKWNYEKEIQYLTRSSARNEFIANLALDQEGNTLVFFNFIDHGKELQQILNKKAPEKRVYIIYKDIPAKERERIRLEMDKETNAIILATYATFSTGINIPNLHNVVFAHPVKGKIRNIQSIGRGLRVRAGKEKAILYDISDDLKVKTKENFSLKHLQERIKAWVEEGYTFKIFKDIRIQ